MRICEIISLDLLAQFFAASDLPAGVRCGDVAADGTDCSPPCAATCQLLELDVEKLLPMAVTAPRSCSLAETVIFISLSKFFLAYSTTCDSNVH
jgi:hypothetical protein